PPGIRGSVIALLNGKRKSVKGKPGRKPWDNDIRNFWILQTINYLVDLGVLATRGEAQEDKESACSIVARAMTEAGVPMKEGNVAKIWGSFQRRKRARVSDSIPN